LIVKSKDKWLTIVSHLSLDLTINTVWFSLTFIYSNECYAFRNIVCINIHKVSQHCCLITSTHSATSKKPIHLPSMSSSFCLKMLTVVLTDCTLLNNLKPLLCYVHPLSDIVVLTKSRIIGQTGRSDSALTEGSALI